MKKPWADKLKFLKSLSKDGKYQDLLREVDQMFLSNVSLFGLSPMYIIEALFRQRVIYAKASTDHPTWASWTWAQAWLPEELHSGGDKPIWQWLQSQPYVPDVSSEGASGNSSVDRIALGIGCLLRDMEGMQFSEEFHPPHHVAHSNISFDVVPSIIHPVLENFLKIVRDHNNQVSDFNCH
jgi:hypothetical protein